MLNAQIATILQFRIYLLCFEGGLRPSFKLVCVIGVRCTHKSVFCINVGAKLQESDGDIFCKTCIAKFLHMTTQNL